MLGVSFLGPVAFSESMGVRAFIVMNHPSLHVLWSSICAFTKSFTCLPICMHLKRDTYTLYGHFRPCFCGWLKQFNHSHPPSTNFNPSYQQQNFTATILNSLQPTSTNFTHLPPLIYH
uniref:Uncharacterized protein n=1 Tax=Opuntia streptacantha TaxID=393608 RepID=A0A7C8YF77_OPUST